MKIVWIHELGNYKSLDANICTDCQKSYAWPRNFVRKEMWVLSGRIYGLAGKVSVLGILLREAGSGYLQPARAIGFLANKQTGKDNHNLGDIVFITHTWKRKERGTALQKKRTSSLPIWQLRRTLGVKHPNLKKRAQENNDKKVKMRKAKALVYHRKRKWAMVFGAKYLK